MTQALVHILKGAGSQFDPALVEAMMDTRAELNGIHRTFADSRPPGGWDGPATVQRFPTVRQDIRDLCVAQPARLKAA
jgi:HD-GYP domain-containing protein (c-di-GMP phosphodiesterase class II)